MRAIVVACLVMVVGACSPPASSSAEESAGAPEPTQSQAAEFTAPSGNIGCIYTPAGGTEVYQTPDGAAELQCDRIEPTYVRVVLPEHDAAHQVETQERGCCSGDALAYGAHWSAGPFQCDMADTGLTCASAEGHGFSLSRADIDAH